MNTLTPARCNRPQWHRGLALLLLTLALPLCAAESAVPNGTASTAITINGSRVFDIDDQTQILLDGQPLSVAQFNQLSPGFNALVRVENADPTLTRGNAAQIDIRNLVRGPVTATDPLNVLNQPLAINGETVLVDVPGNDPANIAVGDIIEVSGFLDPNGSIVAARIQFRTNPPDDWKLSGYVTGLAGEQFSIGAQPVDFTGITPQECGSALQNGHFVEVETLVNAGYTATSILSQVVELHCDDPNFTNPPPGQSMVSLEGVIQAIPDPLPTPPSFTLLDLDIVTTPTTQYRQGSVDDLDVGVRVEVEGFFDSASQTVTAREVHFKQAQIRFEAPVDPADVIPGESVTIMGSAVAFSPQTRDEDGIAASGLDESTQVEVRGLMDRDGNMFATRIRERGNPDLGDTELRGPVSTIDRPNLVILGIDVDGSSAVFFDQDNQPISADQFFALVRIGTIVSAEDASYDPDTGTMIAGKLELEDDVALPLPAPGEGVVVNALSRGTVTGTGIEQIFANGFE
jgi:hypothetical protein